MATGSAFTAYNEVMRSLQKEDAALIYCFYGTERWLRQKLVNGVRKNVLSGRGSEFNHDRFNASETSSDVVFDAVQTMPMLGKRRLVEVEDVHRWKADELNGLEKVVDKLSDHACLLLVADNLDGRLKLFKKIKKIGVVLKLDQPAKRELHGFVENESEKLGRSLSPAASAMLVELVGRDLGLLSASIEKASLYAGEEKVLTEEHVRAVVPDLRQVIIFELTDAFGAGHKETALDALRRLLQEGESPQVVLVMLGRQVRLLWTALDAMRKGTSMSDLAGALKIHPFVARKIGMQARDCTAHGLRRAHRAVCRADRSMKFSKVSAGVLLEKLLLEITTTIRLP